MDILALVINLSQPGDDDTKHLGEAETIVIIRNRQIEAMFITDDGGARAIAERDGIKVYSTWDLIALATRAGKITMNESWGYARTLRAERRGWPPCEHNRTAFEAWARG